jgi:DNA repair exonuclease SbcCD ATPase subunit
VSDKSKQKFKELSSLKYVDQLTWFLNGYIGGAQFDGAKANTCWDYYKAFVELDKLGPTRAGENGTELDQFWSAKFLEDNDKAITALERKAALKELDVDQSGKMSLLEYLTWKFKKGIDEVATLSQGDNQAAIAAAQKKLDIVQAQLRECEAKLEQQKAAKEANEIAIEKLQKEEASLAQLQAELQAAVAALEAEQQAYNAKCSALETKIADPSTSSMQKSKAQNELAQLKGEDPLPLRRAKITQEAALRKVEKQLKQVAVAQEEAARKQAALEDAIKQLEAAYVQLEAKLAEAQKEVQKAKESGTGGQGAIYCMERVLFDADARLPTARMKFDHKKPFNFVCKK